MNMYGLSLIVWKKAGLSAAAAAAGRRAAFLLQVPLLKLTSVATASVCSLLTSFTFDAFLEALLR